MHKVMKCVKYMRRKVYRTIKNLFVQIEIDDDFEIRQSELKN